MTRNLPQNRRMEYASRRSPKSGVQSSGASTRRTSTASRLRRVWKPSRRMREPHAYQTAENPRTAVSRRVIWGGGARRRSR